MTVIPIIISLFRHALGWRHRRLRAKAFAMAVRDLPLHDRQVFLMCAAEGRPRAAVADAMGITEAEVGERLAGILTVLAHAVDEATQAVAPERPRR